MKKTYLLITLIPALLFSCSPANENSSSLSTSTSSEKFGSNFVYSEPEEVAIDVSKTGLEVVSVEVINIPDGGIKVAAWDEANIKLHVLYSDSTTQDFPFLVKHMPLDARHYLGEIGHHNVEILVNAHKTTFGFNIIKNSDFAGYKCTFYDAYSQGQVYETTVGYYQNVAYDGPSLEDHPVGTEFFRHFIGWDYPLINVHQDMVYNSIYRDCEKRYYGDSVKEGLNHVVSTYKDEENSTYHVLTYLGRVHRVALNYGETIYHKQGDEAVDLSLQELTLFNERWEQLNKDIVKYGLQYNFDSTAGQYLFGSSSAFNGSTNFLTTFETIYSKTSYVTTLDTGANIHTSSYPNHETVYTIANDHKDDTDTVTSDLESGYYRLAVVANFDVYASVSFTKLANGKYNLEPNSKYMFSPITASVDVLAQYSDTEEFGNNYEKKVEFSNKMFYDIASSLNWGN